jgi:hypothetical protein
MRQAHGLTGRFGIGDKLAVLAELDGLITSRRDLGYVGFVQLDFELIQGLHLMGTGETVDQGNAHVAPGDPVPLKTPGSGKPRCGGWLSAAWFIYSHFDIRLDAIKRTQEDAQLLAQLHVYL